MLSYRHGFHAGNFADLLKHIVQVEILTHLTQKAKPFEYIDTHAGAGFYRLDAAEAVKNHEYLTGIGHFKAGDGERWPPLARYLAQVERHNPPGAQPGYPGSPALAEGFLRPGDKAWLFELHPQDHSRLAGRYRQQRQIRVRQEDGYRGLLGLLPCASRRALVLLDPPYENKADYQQVADTVVKAHRKMATAIFALWYPVVDRGRIDALEKRLVDSGMRRIQQFELGVRADTPERGMTSAGMIVVNPPWGLFDNLAALLPHLAETLTQDGQPHYRCRTLVDE